MRIYGHETTVNHRLLLVLFVIISIFLPIDCTLSLLTKEKLLHLHYSSSLMSLSFLIFLLFGLYG